MEVDIRKTKTLMLRTWKEMRRHYDKDTAMEMVEESFNTNELSYSFDDNRSRTTIRWGNSLTYFNSEEGKTFMKELYELPLARTLVEFKNTMSIIWEHLRMNYDRKTSIRMIEESFVTRKLTYKCGENGLAWVEWDDNMMTSINSVEGKLYLEELFKPNL
jgi:hypothetical protein